MVNSDEMGEKNQSSKQSERSKNREKKNNRSKNDSAKHSDDEEKGSNEKKITLKTPKGMRDFDFKQMTVREMVFKTITDVFKRHGAMAIDTPVCERKDVLTGKYGEDSKLIYDLQDQGGELLSLRYDLTVPFARYLAQNKIQNLKRFHIAKVYRRDNPSVTKGRFREFYQCDFDIAGKYDSMIPDVECLRIIYEILNELNLDSFQININHRKILEGMFAVCGVPADKFQTICSSIDKLDKNSWEDVEREMIKEKGLEEQAAKRIEKFIKLNGSSELVNQLLADELGQNQSAIVGLNEIKLLFEYAELFKIKSSILFNLSLARGLDYYTGLIYEVIITDKSIECGSIAAGGRYDNLVSTLIDNDRWQVPCVGLSIGIERILSIIEEKMSQDVGSPSQVLVISIGSNLLEERIKLLVKLWEANIRAEHIYKKSVKLLTNYQFCESNLIPYAIILGENELNQNKYKIRDIKTREEIEIDTEDVVTKIKELLKIE